MRELRLDCDKNGENKEIYKKESKNVAIENIGVVWTYEEEEPVMNVEDHRMYG